MAKNTQLRGARRRLVSLTIILLSIAAVIAWAGAIGRDASFTPKLALDLQGGTSIILQPTLGPGQTLEAGTLDQAVGIIRQRVDSTGVSEAQVATQGTGANAVIVVSIPGEPSADTLALIKASAQLQFRAVLATSAATNASVGKKGSATATSKPVATSAPIATSSAKPTDGSDLNWVSHKLLVQYDNLQCRKSATSTVADFRTPGQVDDPTKPLVTCDRAGSVKYILGPVELDGTDISDATAGTTTTSTGAMTNTWAINLNFKSAGSDKFGKVTTRLYPLTSPRNQFAVTLDGYVLTAPQTNAVITNGSAQITGNFTSATATALANQLKYGSLPISFNVQSVENISATLGSAQLMSGLLAGAIGLLLVIIYSIFQYRALAIVTIGSLAVAAVATYLLICLLSWRQGYRLSLSGVTGLIVAIGITADSFIVYFERVRDEIREGKPLGAAVQAGWSRAWRTILVSDAVNLLAALTLYLLTVGNVRGFAFTLGLTTIIDLAIVLLFTHSMLEVLATSKFFQSGHPWSGFDLKSASSFGYTGRGQFRVSEVVSEGKAKKTSREAARRQTIAERKANSDGSN